MNLQGTPGRTKIVPIDPNNQRVDLDQAVINTLAEVAAPKPVPPPAVSPPSSSTSSTQLDARQGNYSGSVPSWVPESGKIGIGIDVSNNRIWWYFSGTWQ